jgi:hypothetical protein
MKSDARFTAKFFLLSLAASVLLGGCAAPIKSRLYTPGESYEGLRYLLSKTTVTVKYFAQLRSCSEGAGANQPLIELLAPSMSTQVSADPSTSYVINPADSVNWFRKIDVPALKLSVDGRLAEADAKSVDSTPAILLDLARTAVATQKAFRINQSVATASRFSLFSATDAVARLPLAEVSNKRTDSSKTLPNATCTPRAINLLKQFNDAKTAYAALRALTLRRITAGSFGEHAADSFKAMRDEEGRLLVLIKALEGKLTIGTEVSLDSETLADEPVMEYFDVATPWINETNYYGCSTLAAAPEQLKARVASTDDDKKKAAEALKALLPLQPLCIGLTATLKNNSPTIAGGSATHMAGAEYPGLMFRVPGSGSVKVTATGSAIPSQPKLLSNFVANENARPESNGWQWAIDKTTKKENEVQFTHVYAGVPPILQFGNIAKMPSDVGALTSNSIHTTFDANGVPAAVNWSADPLPVNALLGLPAQISGLRPAPVALPSANNLLQNDLLNRMLQSCIDAIAAGSAVPSYCAGVVGN